MQNDKEQDIILVKDTASKDIIYHYDRKERLKMRHKKNKNGGKGLFRNKALLIIVGDIILIVLIFIFINSPVFKAINININKKKNIEDFHMTLSGYRIKDKVFARLYIERINKPEKNGEEYVNVQFSMDNEGQVDMKEKLPEIINQGIKIQATLVCKDNKKELTAKVLIAEKTEILRILPLER